MSHIEGKREKSSGGRKKRKRCTKKTCTSSPVVLRKKKIPVIIDSSEEDESDWHICRKIDAQGGGENASCPVASSAPCAVGKFVRCDSEGSFSLSSLFSSPATEHNSAVAPQEVDQLTDSQLRVLLASQSFSDQQNGTSVDGLTEAEMMEELLSNEDSDIVNGAESGTILDGDARMERSQQWEAQEDVHRWLEQVSSTVTNVAVTGERSLQDDNHVPPRTEYQAEMENVINDTSDIIYMAGAKGVDDDIQIVPTGGQSQEILQLKETVKVKNELIERFESTVQSLREQLGKVTVELTETKEKSSKFREWYMGWEAHERRMNEKVSHGFELVSQLRDERDRLKAQLELCRDRVVFLEKKGPLPASYPKVDKTLHEKLVETETKLRAFGRILKQAGLRDIAGLPHWTFAIPPEKGVSDYGEIVLSDLDEDSLLDAISISEEVLQLFMEKFKRDNLKNDQQNWNGLRCSDFHVYHTGFFRDINHAEILKEEASAEVAVTLDSHPKVQSTEKESVSSGDGKDIRQLIDAQPPLHWGQGRNWGNDDIEKDFDDRVGECAKWAAREDYENELYWRWSNKMFQGHIKGIFFPVGVCDHWMLMIRLFAERLSDLDRQVFRQLFPNNRAETIGDSFNGGSLVNVDLKKDCWILLDPGLRFKCPRHHVKRSIETFLNESYKIRMQTNAVPISFTHLPCYIAIVPQQGDIPDCALFVGEFFRRLLKGLHFHNWAPDMVPVRRTWSRYFQHMKKMNKKRHEIGKNNLIVLEEKSPSEKDFLTPLRSRKRKGKKL